MYGFALKLNLNDAVTYSKKVRHLNILQSGIAQSKLRKYHHAILSYVYLLFVLFIIKVFKYTKSGNSLMYLYFKILMKQ